MKKTGILVVCIFLFSMYLTSQSDFSNIFHRYEFTFEEPVEDMFTEDLNEDDLMDLLVITKSSENKILHIFFQKKSGFSNPPDQAFLFDKKAVVFDLGDIVDQYQGKEIVYLTSDSINYYYLDGNLYHEQSAKLVDTSSILQSSSPECPVRSEFIFDLKKENSNILLVPEPEWVNLFLKEQKGELNKTQNVNLKPYFRTSSPLRLQEEDSGIELFSQKVVLQVPKIYFEDFNGDEKKDIISVFKDKVEVFFHKEPGSFSREPDFEIDLEVLSEEEKKKALRPMFKVEVVDLNTDGMSDIFVTKNTIKTTTGVTKIYIYLNKEGKINPVPDQIIVLDSSFGYPQILDLNGDKHKDLIIAELKFGLLQIVKILITKKVSYQEGVYLGKDGKYPQKPDFKLKSLMRFDFENTENIEGEFMHFDGDFDGDGINDLLKSSSNESKFFIYLDYMKEKKLSKKASYESKESILPLELVIKDLNNDNISDIIFDFRRNEKKKAVVFLSR